MKYKIVIEKIMKIEKNPHFPPTHIFLKKFARNLFIGCIIIAICLFIGMAGYHYFENMSWLEAYESASMILSGMGPIKGAETSSGKLFAGSYALFSGVLFLVTIAIIFTPVIHRLFHKFHIEE